MQEQQAGPPPPSPEVGSPTRRILTLLIALPACPHSQTLRSSSLSSRPMDTDLTFPAPRVPDPPPLLESLFIELLEDSDLSHFPLSHPLTTEDLPNSEAGRITVHTLARLHETFATPFNTLDRVLNCETWLQVVYKALIAIHEGLRNAQLASPDTHLADAFDPLEPAEAAITGRVYTVVNALRDFFWSEAEDRNWDNGFLKTHCFCYIQSVDLPPLPEAMQSVQLTTELDWCHIRESLLNSMIQEVHREVDEWRSSQRVALISRVVDLITADPATTPTSISVAAYEQDPCLKTWVDNYGDRMQAHVRETITRDVRTDKIDIWAQEHLGSLLMAKWAEVTAEVDASFD
jgi:hypothetical protein